MLLGKLTTAMHELLTFFEPELSGAARDWLHDARRHYRLERPVQRQGATVIALISHTHGGGKTEAARRVASLSLRGMHFEHCQPLSGLWDEDIRVKRCFDTRRILVLDDLGIESEHPRMIGRLCALIDHRHRLGRMTILTTNLTPSMLAEAYSDRLIDRLAGFGVVVECPEPSMRGNEPNVTPVVAIDYEVGPEPKPMRISDREARELTDGLLERLTGSQLFAHRQHHAQRPNDPTPDRSAS